MAINRLRRPPRPVTLTHAAQTTLYEIELSEALELDLKFTA
jgi:hypothetical protein